MKLFPFRCPCPACGFDKGEAVLNQYGEVHRYRDYWQKFCNGSFLKSCPSVPHIHRKCYNCNLKFLTHTKTDMITDKASGGELSLSDEYTIIENKINALEEKIKHERSRT